MELNILKEFNKEGLSAEALITENEVKTVLDSICLKNLGTPFFDQEVFKELWNETRDSNERDNIKLKDFIGTLLKAEQILREQIDLAQQQLRSDFTIQSDPLRKNEVLNNLFSYSQDHRTITMPFGIQQVTESKEIAQSKKLNMIHQGKSRLFTDVLDEREESTDLKVVLMLTLILLALELLVMFQKHHFFTLLGILLIHSAYVLNYFERKYVLLLLGWTLFSILLDLVWMIVNASTYWEGGAHITRSTIHIGFIRLVVVLVCLQMLVKLALIGLLFKYKSVGEGLRKRVSICGMTFHLDSQPDPLNLFVGALKWNSQNRQHSSI